MYAYKFSSDFDPEKKSDKENVLEELKKIDGKYSFSSSSDNNDDLDYQKMEYTAPTKEEVLKTAEKSLEEYKDSSISEMFKAMRNFEKENFIGMEKLENEQ
mgnify:CR=1 FL=1